MSLVFPEAKPIVPWPGLGAGASVSGPSGGVSTDNAVVRWDGTTGRTVQNSVIIVADTTGAMSGWTTGAGLTFHGGGTITGASGSLDFTASGTNQNITLTPSGTGNVITSAILKLTHNVAGEAGLLIQPSSGVGTAKLAFWDGGGTPNKWEVGTGFGSATDGKFFIYDARNARSLLIGGTTGNTLLGGLTTDGTGVLQFPAGAADNTSGATFGADTNVYRSSAGQMVVNRTATNGGAIAVASGGTIYGNYWADTANSAVKIGSQNASYSTIITSGNFTTALTIDSSQNATFAGAIIGGVQALSGAGAVNVTQLHTSYTSTGAAQALTLANGTAGQIKTITHTVDGGSGVLTPTTAVGYTTITFVNAGDSVTLRYTSVGWAVIGSYGAVIA